MTTTETDTTPRVWPACLHCYNSGHLVGRWVDCTDAADVTLAQLHEGTRGGYAGCEEIWCLDTENIPDGGEMGLNTADEWGECFKEVGPHLWPALCAWVRSGAHVVEGHGPIPSVSDFEERYCGHWESFREYAEQLADYIGLQQGWFEEAIGYFNWASWVADQAHDYTVVEVGADQGYGVFVFRSLEAAGPRRSARAVVPRAQGAHEFRQRDAQGVRERAGDVPVRIAVHEYGDPETAAALAERLTPVSTTPVPVVELPAVLAAHLGLGALGVVMCPLESPTGGSGD